MFAVNALGDYRRRIRVRVRFEAVGKFAYGPNLHIGIWTITLERFHYYLRFEFGRRRRDRCNEKLATATRHESTRSFHAFGNDPLFVFAVQQADVKLPTATGSPMSIARRLLGRGHSSPLREPDDVQPPEACLDFSNGKQSA
jgi:hypothetical protein